MDILDKKILNKDTDREIKISSAINYPKNSDVYKTAHNIIDKKDNDNNDNNDDDKEKSNKKINSRSHKPKVEKRAKGSPNPFIKKYGKLKLNAFPQDDVKEEDVKVNLSGDIHSHAVLSWRDPKTGRMVNSYTSKFLKRNAKIKWARVKKLDDFKVHSIMNKTTELLNNKNKIISDSAAIINIISKTGLRIGDHENYKMTKNRGVMTLSSDNVKIEGDLIKLNFLGKSYQENNAEIKDEKLANYLKKRVEENSGKEFLFETDYHEVNKIFDKFAGKKFKIKDLRTYTATKMAADILKNDKTPPPPLPDGKGKIKKAIKDKLKNVFTIVSQKLNNTPGMAKSSYVHPEVIKNFLKTLGVEEEVMQAVYKEHKEYFVNLLTENKKYKTFKVTGDFEECDEYPLPDWWDNENIDLVLVKNK